MNKTYINIPVKITSYELIKELYETYKDYADDLYVILDGNTNYVSLSMCYKTLNKINEIASFIKSKNLSQIEQIMAVYDLLKERMYKKESCESDHLKSRDLSEVLFGDYIVCVGYTRLFNAILSNLGIECFDIEKLHKDDNKGHMRNLVYINDETYDIEGYYYFDVTRDAKQDENSNIYKYRYLFFGKTESEIQDLDCDKYILNEDIYSALARESKIIDKDILKRVIKRINNKKDDFQNELSINISNLN